jgi:DNA adenine methylase
MKGRFILSINDLPEVREVFSGFRLVPVSLTYSITGGKGTPAKELIITG